MTIRWCEWLANLINEEPDFEVCGSVGNTREALGLIGTLLPRIVVVDISLDGGSGLELIKDVKATHPQVDMIVLSITTRCSMPNGRCGPGQRVMS